MRRKRLLFEVGIVALVLFLLLWTFIPKFLDAQTFFINSERFPDASVQQAVANAFKTGLGSPITYRQAKEFRGEINIQNASNLTGLHLFPNAEKLYIYSDRLPDIDLSFIPNLEVLYYSGSNLRSVNTSKNQRLRYVTLVNSSSETPVNVPDFDFSRNQNIQQLTIRNFYIETLDVSKLEKLYLLDCTNAFRYDPIHWNEVERGLTQLDVRNSPNLKTLNVTFNRIKELDTSNNPNLWQLYCSYNQLTKLDLSNNTRLRILHCDSNLLQSLNVLGCIGLDTFSGSNNQLRELNLSNHEFLKHIRCNQNQLRSLDISASNRLLTLNAEDNPLEIIRLPSIQAITQIKADKTRLTPESLALYELYEKFTESPIEKPSANLFENAVR